MPQGSYKSASGTTTVNFDFISLPEIPFLQSNVRDQHTPGQNGANSVAIDELSSAFAAEVITTSATWTQSATKDSDILNGIKKQKGTLTVHGASNANIRLNGVEVIENRKAGGASTMITHQRMNLFFTRLA